MNIGILALQGDFAKHREAVERLGARSLLVRKAAQLSAIDGIVLPGGESTTLLKMMDVEFRAQLKQALESGMACLATCAGLILLADSVTDPAQESLGVLGLTVSRNAYGRQKESFITSELQWTDAGQRQLAQLGADFAGKSAANSGFFIRAPRITNTSKQVEVLIELKGEPVCIKQNKIIGASYHPELLNEPSALHSLFLRNCLQ